MRRWLRIALMAASWGVAAFAADDTLTNDSILVLMKSGLSEETIVGIINAQPGRYSLTAEHIVALQKAGASEKVIAAIVKKSQSPAVAAPVEISKAGAALPAGVSDIGVYCKKAGAWSELLPEVVNWKTGGTLKNLASAGVVKKDVNGLVSGPHSRNSVKTPLEFLIYTPEGVAISEYQLIRFREKPNAREFRTVTGGVFNQSGGVTRDLVPFEGKRLGNRMFEVILPNLGAGEYGFLPPGAMPSGSTHASLGKIFTFRLLE
ncbi:MAG: hypothetical protein ACE15B_13020 [Bryobacteraceae bacterium]